ncbi:mitochondrial carrier homolog 1-like isoform X3 [Periophthalmus magnuspinnatus]|uniref:mitochondrial carrier homolog 1-like isoform X3 n=1 Tax=Periophthalmus magnuspinnatus TaxID=409849 RepID=UPI00145AE60A|nr:mitochondrial carrier homolog 1-like isoform X3 [Periophthalmus magnuspinnatus]
MDPPENQAGAEVSDVDREETPSPAEVLSAAVLLGAGATAIQHPVIYIKLLIQVGHEPLPPTWGTTLFGRKVLYLPGLFSYAQHILQVDGKCGLFRGLSPHIVCCAVSTVVKRKVKQMELISAKEEQETSLKALVKDTSHEMLVRCLSRVACHPFHVLSVRCMAQFVGREVKYSGMLSCMVQIFKEEGLAGFYVGLVPHVLGELLYLWGYNLLCHFINTYAEDDTFSQASAIRSYTKFVMNIAVNVLRYPFTLVADLMALNDCGLAAGLPPYSPVFKSWLHCWSHLCSQGNLFRGSSLFFRRVPASVIAAVEL